MLLIRAPKTNMERLPSFKSMFEISFSQLNETRLRLLVPFILLSGATQSFIVGDFSAFAITNSTRYESPLDKIHIGLRPCSGSLLWLRVGDLMLLHRFC
jgi:hypothetical protein